MSHVHRPRPVRGRTIDAPGLVEEFRRRELSRRALLKSAIAGSATYLGAGLVGCKGKDYGGGSGSGDGGSDAGGPLDSGAGDAGGDSGPPPPRHLVGMGWAESAWIEAFDAALAETLGLSFVQPGDTVYFKVNCNNGDFFPHSTRPDLIVELAARCRDLGAKRLIVGDRSFWGDRNTLGNMERNGVADAAADAGAELVVFEDADVEWVATSEADAPDWVGGFRLPVPVMEADHIVNLPCVKTHFIATFTMALKNLFGIVNPVDRAREGNLDVHAYPRVWRQISQVNQAVTPSLNILDGWEALTTGGPTVGDPPGPTYEEPHLLVVSTDRIATDVTGIAILQTLSPDSEEVTQSAAWANPQIVEAVRDGVGISGPDEYDLSGPTVPDLDRYRGLATKA